MKCRLLAQEVTEINNDEISKFKPFVRYYVIGAALCTVIMILVTLDLFSPGEFITTRDKLLLVFNFVFILLEIGFYFIIKKGIQYTKSYNGKIIRDLNEGAIDFVFHVRNKFKFINDAEERINNNFEKKYALIHYDIKKFSIINNSVGYKVGDDILKKICKIFTKELKDEVFGKAEGDKFFVLFDYEGQEELIERMLKISEKIEHLRIWKKINIKPAVNMGIYFIDNDEIDIRVAIDRAEFAKSHLKNGYNSEYAFYNESLGNSLIEARRIEDGMHKALDNNEFKVFFQPKVIVGNSLIEARRIEDGMHKALDNNEFKVFFQPKVSLKNGNLSGAEALVRWNHPELGLLSPAKFIHIFEKNGFIINLDKYVFEQVCVNMKKWIDRGYEVVPVSVNVSRIHFSNNDFVEEYNKIKGKYGIPNNLIEIEITESVVFNNDNEESIFTVMKKFKNEGFEISMDDFGSGYSSLGLLKEMPIDTLKLDKVFLNHIEENSSQIIMDNIVDIAKKLSLKVVSEGVETDLQVDFLKKIGCDMAQGFIFSTPKPVEEYEKLISTGKTNYYNLA
jgi:diguanylate cyclase (GGDEF)-like protein